MRDIDTAFQQLLDSGTTTICRCWSVTRLDGVSLGFTDHDRDITFDGLTFKADTGMTAHALERSTGLSVDNGQAVGALSAVGLREEDMLAGVYDDAEISHWLVDWQNPEARVLEFRGTLGEIRRAGGAFEAELRSLSEQLNQPVGRAFLKTCDRALGDAGCKVDLSDPAFFGDARVEAVFGNRDLQVSGLDGFAADWFMHGGVEWLTGNNAGLRHELKLDANPGPVRRLELWQEAPFEIAEGDMLRVTAGCDKRRDTCRDKFANVLNFRGFPHMPGDDWVTAYPTRGGSHTGLSLFKG